MSASWADLELRPKRTPASLLLNACPLLDLRHHKCGRSHSVLHQAGMLLASLVSLVSRRNFHPTRVRHCWRFRPFRRFWRSQCPHPSIVPSPAAQTWRRRDAPPVQEKRHIFATDVRGNCIGCRLSPVHPLHICPLYRRLDVSQKIQLVRKHNRCGNCLVPGHHDPNASLGAAKFAIKIISQLCMTLLAVPRRTPWSVRSISTTLKRFIV